MHPGWKLYINFVSGQPGIKFIETDLLPQWLFWICLFGFGVLNGALFFSSVPRGIPGMLWRLSSVGIVFAASAGFCVLKFRWEMREALAINGPDVVYSTQAIPVLSVFLPAMLLCAGYLVHLACTKHQKVPMCGPTAGTPDS